MSPRNLLFRPVWLVFVLLVVGVTRAEDPAPEEEPEVLTPAHLRIDRPLRYSCDFGTLRRINLRPTEHTAMTAFLRDDAASRDRLGSRLFIERVLTSPERLARKFAGRTDPVESDEDARLAGKPAYHSVIKRKQGGWKLVRVQKGDPAKGYWALTALCEGEKADEDLEVIRKVVDSFTTDLSKPCPEGVYEDRFFGYRISFAGMEGPKKKLPAVAVEMCSLREGEKALGHFTVWVGPCSNDRAADWKEIQKFQEKQGATLEKTGTLTIGGLPARDSVWEQLDWEKKPQTLRARHIRDDGACWIVQAIVPGHDVDPDAGTAKKIFAALESFRVHPVKKENAPKGD